MVGAAHQAEAEPDHVHGGATESKRSIPIQLYNPAGFECADGIHQKPGRRQIDVDGLTFR
jgi:hypothetical protein